MRVKDGFHGNFDVLEGALSLDMRQLTRRLRRELEVSIRRYRSSARVAAEPVTRTLVSESGSSRRSSVKFFNAELQTRVR